MELLSDFAKEVRKKVFRMMYESQTAHLGSCLSCIDILTVLYNKVLYPNKDYRFPYPDPKTLERIGSKKKWEELKRPTVDRFILSKGHAAAALYATLAQKGYFPEEVLDTYCKEGGLHGHPEKDCLPGVEVSTGSLGHGLPMGCGMALALKGPRVFVLMSDGEMDEGTTWESALFTAHHKLDNLIVIIDENKWQAFGRTKEVLNLEPLAEKWKAFGWEVKEVDGHNYQELSSVLSFVPFVRLKPSCLIAHTIKGRGWKRGEDKLESHYLNITKDEADLY